MEMPSNEFQVRECTKEDSLTVEQMIRELAIYENLINNPQIDHHIIEKDGFGPQRSYFIFVAQLLNTNELIGYILSYYKNSTEGKVLWIKDLFVKSDYRHLGAGRVLLTTLTKFAAKQSCDGLEWRCCHWNHSAIKFYKRFGGRALSEEDGWIMFRIDQEQIKTICDGLDTH